MKKNIMFSVIVFSCFTYSCSQKLGTFTDSRDNQTYKWVKIGNQVWMAENLNVGTRINSVYKEQVQTNNNIIEKYCYDDTVSYCDIYGGLYEWNEMMQYASSDDKTIGTTQGICPSGWHLPTDAEWTALIDYFGGTSVAGGKMKEIGPTHWNPPNVVEINESGFSALPGGYRDWRGFFNQLRDYGYFWSATEDADDSSVAWSLILDGGNAGVSRFRYTKDLGRSVRCLKD